MPVASGTKDLVGLELVAGISTSVVRVVTQHTRRSTALCCLAPEVIV